MPAALAEHDASSGTVYDPKGTLPLYDVYVYVPNAPLDPITTGPVCTPCQAPASGKPLAVATTNEPGQFELTNVSRRRQHPARRANRKVAPQITLPHVSVAKDNMYNTKASREDSTVEALVRMPKQQAEGSPDDNIPLIAVTTGACDYGECFLMNTIGIDATEFADGGRVNIYDGHGGETARSDTLRHIGTTLFGDAKTLNHVRPRLRLVRVLHVRSRHGLRERRGVLERGRSLLRHALRVQFLRDNSQCSGDPTTCKGPADFNGVAQWEPEGADDDPGPYTITGRSEASGRHARRWSRRSKKVFDVIEAEPIDFAR